MFGQTYICQEHWVLGHTFCRNIKRTRICGEFWTGHLPADPYYTEVGKWGDLHSIFHFFMVWFRSGIGNNLSLVVLFYLLSESGLHETFKKSLSVIEACYRQCAGNLSDDVIHTETYSMHGKHWTSITTWGTLKAPVCRRLKCPQLYLT